MKTKVTIGILFLFLVSVTSLQAQRRGNGESSSTSTSTQTINTRSTSSSSNSNNRSATTIRSSRNDDKSVAPSSQKVASSREVSGNKTISIRQKEIKKYPVKDHVVVTKRKERIVDQPHKYHVVKYNDIDYHYSDGRFYRYYDGRYIATIPPHGVFVPSIPATFLRILVRDIPYYYSYGVYYKYDSVYSRYVVVEAPMGAIVPELPEYDVKAVVINGKTYLEYDNILYKAIVTNEGLQYKVMGTLADF